MQKNRFKALQIYDQQYIGLNMFTSKYKIIKIVKIIVFLKIKNISKIFLYLYNQKLKHKKKL